LITGSGKSAVKNFWRSAHCAGCAQKIAAPERKPKASIGAKFLGLLFGSV